MTLTSTQHHAALSQQRSTLHPSGVAVVPTATCSIPVAPTGTYQIDDWTLVQVSGTQWDLRGPDWDGDGLHPFLAEFGIDPDWTCEWWTDLAGDGVTFYAPGFHPRV